MHGVRKPGRNLVPTGGDRGFALIVVISLMVLLIILGVAMLSLSAISLRSASTSTDQVTARTNARLALLVAIGELQRQVGPDQRVTARSDIVDKASADSGESIANPRLTGVWDSWEIKPTEPPTEEDYGVEAKDAKFRGWLVSSNQPAATRQVDFAQQDIPSPVTLLGEQTLAGLGSDDDIVEAGKLIMDSPPGACAWAVLDEGIKARINTPFSDGASSDGAKTAQLGAGERPAAERLPGLDGLEPGQFKLGSGGFTTIEKGVSRQNFGLAGEQLAEGSRAALAALTHDVTPHSVGLFTDTARGGLKEDLQLLTNAEALPEPYAGKGVYASRLGMSASDAPSDPYWDSLHEFARVDRDRITNFRGTPLLKAQWPSRWKAATPVRGETRIDLRPPPGVVLMPTIAKVQMVFSLVGRDLYTYSKGGSPRPSAESVFHHPQGDYFLGTRYEYDLHLLYTPVVTLHNPYNVALEFQKMRVEFQCVPFSARVFRNGQPQATAMVPLDRMFADNEAGAVGPKIFGMDLLTKTSSDRPGTPAFRLLPGETKLFSPYIDPNRTYYQEVTSRGAFWDIYVGTEITNNIEAIPGWRGDGIGFDLDWWNPSDVRIPGPDKENGRWAGCIGMSSRDRFHVEFAPRSDPQLSNNKFTILVSAATSSRSTRMTHTSAIEIDYERPDGLQYFLLGRGKTLRYPEDPRDFISAMDMFDHSSVAIKDLARVKPFALMTVHAKTTSGGRDPSHEDGRFATKPWSFAHGVAGASSQKILSEHPSNHSHEIDLQMLDGSTANILQVDLQDRANFITGHTPFNGIKFGALYDIPLHPLQALPALNGANPGGSSGFLPRFAQPIGNSWAHPQIASDRLIDTGTAGNLLDHSFLLNLALYDGFYFSGLADQTGAFGSGRTTADLAGEFAAGTPLDDPRLVMHHPNGRTNDEFTSEIGGADAFARSAAWQMFKGPFNINSTSPLAWKAMLGSIQDAEAIYNEIDKGSSQQTASTALKPLPAREGEESRISRFRLPAASSAEDGAEPAEGYWLGPREYTDADLQVLSERIVEQVRERGPFLSMAEFVNRQLGSDEKALSGALQQAIDEADLNEGLAGAANAGFEIAEDDVADYQYAHPAAGAGSSSQGAPGYLSQADLLTVLGNAATARSDTFTIRAYGEARGKNNKITAQAWCEAVIQRMPEWVDPVDPVEARPADLSSQANKTFGRRFLVTSFRWLNPSEI